MSIIYYELLGYIVLNFAFLETKLNEEIVYASIFAYVMICILINTLLFLLSRFKNYINTIEKCMNEHFHLIEDDETSDEIGESKILKCNDKFISIYNKHTNKINDSEISCDDQIITTKTKYDDDALSKSFNDDLLKSVILEDSDLESESLNETPSLYDDDSQSLSRESLEKMDIRFRIIGHLD